MPTVDPRKPKALSTPDRFSYRQPHGQAGEAYFRILGGRTLRLMNLVAGIAGFGCAFRW